MKPDRVVGWDRIQWSDVTGRGGRLAPDTVVDSGRNMQRSLLGSKVPVLSAIFKLVLGHRGVTHTAVAAALFSLLALAVAPHLGLGAAVCALITLLSASSHVLLDSLTPSGTQALWPLHRRFSGPIRTGGIAELPITLCLGCVLWVLLKGM